jgi:hypothetical protein
MNRIKYIRYSILLLAIFAAVFSFWGFFSIGILSDTFGDAYTAVNSGFFDKISNNLQFIDANRYRPVLFLTLKAIVNINNTFGIHFDNFILYRFLNLFLYLSFAFISGYVVLKISGDLIKATLAEIFILIFPNNLHNLIWSAAYFEIMCGLFCVLSLLFIVKYIVSRKSRFLVYSNILFVLALLTKEISVPFPFICLLIIFLYYGLEETKKYKIVFLSQVIILISYFVAKTFLSSGIPVVSAGYFDSGFFANTMQIIVKGFISLLIPRDYSVIKIGLKELNASLLFYLFALMLILSYYAFCFIREKKIKIIYIILAIFIVSISPYIYAGYIRPQLIMLPFAFVIISIMSVLDSKESMLKYAIIILTVLWITSGYGVMNNWKIAYSKGKERMDNLLKTEIPEGKKCIIVGNPARLQQSFMYDNVMFPYNYFKYHSFILKDTISDLVRTVALDKNSLDARIDIIIINENEYDLTCTGKTQFFYLDDIEKNINENNGIKNNIMSAECLEYNDLGKPVKIKLKLLSDNLICYIFQGSNLEKLK